METNKQNEMVQKFKISGKSQRVWCAENGIKRSTLRYWLKRTELLSLGSDILFAELVVMGDAK